MTPHFSHQFCAITSSNMSIFLLFLLGFFSIQAEASEQQQQHLINKKIENTEYVVKLTFFTHSLPKNTSAATTTTSRMRPMMLKNGSTTKTTSTAATTAVPWKVNYMDVEYYTDYEQSQFQNLSDKIKNGSYKLTLTFAISINLTLITHLIIQKIV